MTRLAEGLSSSATLRIRVVSMLAILMMTMFAPAQGWAVLDECPSVCVREAVAQCLTGEQCGTSEFPSGGACSEEAPLVCQGCPYVWICTDVYALGWMGGCDNEGGGVYACSME